MTIPKGKVALLNQLIQLRDIVQHMSQLYMNYPNLNDDVDIEKIVPMSLDDWELEIDATIDKLS